MSIPVDLSKLAEVMGRYRFAYLLTAGERGAPHAVAVTPVLQGGELVVNESGRRTRDNAQSRPEVALVWPPQSESDYSLIVDGQAVVAGTGLRIAPVRAVLHRPVPSGEPAAPGACGSDCVEIA
jgi:Pyridoxamine 5''-phosphate oxidase.